MNELPAQRPPFDPASPWLTSAPYGLALTAGATLALRLFVRDASTVEVACFAGTLALPLTVAAALGGATRLVCWRSPHGMRRAATLLASTIVVLPVLTTLGAMLKTQTHHRGLGGVTFAIASLLVVLLALAASWRLSHLVRGPFARPIAVIMTSLSLAVFAWALARAHLLGPAGLAWVVVLAAPILGAWGLRLQRSTLGWGAWIVALALTGYAALTLPRIAPNPSRARFGGLAGLLFDAPPASPAES